MQKWQINSTIAGVGGVIAQLLGGWDAMLQFLILVVVIDYVTGILAAIYNCRLSSEIGYKGIIKKVGIFAVILVASMASKFAGSDIIRNITMLFYISNEAISILENVGRCGVRYPNKLRNILIQLNKDEDAVKHVNECKCEDKENCKCTK
jgi:toxin secretion/phage lysis holin